MAARKTAIRKVDWRLGNCCGASTPNTARGWERPRSTCHILRNLTEKRKVTEEALKVEDKATEDPLQATADSAESRASLIAAQSSAPILNLLLVLYFARQTK